jgi:hypothetical protein
MMDAFDATVLIPMLPVCLLVTTNHWWIFSMGNADSVWRT